MITGMNLFCYNHSMGSGKGSMRRAQTIKFLEASFSTKPWKWYGFVDDNELCEVNLYEYYLKRRPLNPTPVEFSKVISEVFADLVAVGAFTLPDGYDVDDFEFRVDQRADLLEISLKRRQGSPGLSEEVHFVPFYMNRERTMGGADYILELLGVGVPNIVQRKSWQ